MTRDHQQESQQDPELERALELVRRPSARPEFRAALRQQFLAGAVEGASPHERTAEPRRVERGPRRGRLALLAGTLAAAAAVVLTVFLSRPRAAVWTVLDGTSATTVLVDGRPIEAANRVALAAALVSAREVEVRGGALRLRVRDEALMELADGTRLSQMQLNAKGPYHLRTDHGSLAVATTPAFGQRGMRILTQDFAVSVTGTRFAVDVSSDGSCVCCLSGTVDCAPATAKTPMPISAGGRCFTPRDRSAPDVGAAFPEHLAPVERLPEGRE